MSEKILVLGLSKSGIAAAKLGINLGYDVYLSEGKSEVNEIQVQELKNLGIKVSRRKAQNDYDQYLPQYRQRRKEIRL